MYSRHQLVTFPCPDQQTSVTTIRLSDNNSQVRYPIRHVRYFIHKQFQMPPLFIQKHFAIWPRLACQQTTALLKEFPGFFYANIACSGWIAGWSDNFLGYLRFALTFSTSCGFLRVGFWTSCALNFLRINCNFTSFCRLRVLAAQELLARHFLRVHYFWAVLYLHIPPSQIIYEINHI